MTQDDEGKTLDMRAKNPKILRVVFALMLLGRPK